MQFIHDSKMNFQHC